MSTIPYNYGKYIDDKVSMSNSGTVDAGRQVQSPASAGSRGLAKTTQFTKDPTQMKMGNSPIAESMVEIRNILNRIDGVNVPVQEGHYPHIKSFDKLYGISDKQQYKAMADDAQSMDMGEFMDTYSSVIDMAGDFWEDHQKTSESMEGTINEDPNTLAKELASEIMRWVRRGFDHIPADALKPKAKEYLRSIKESAVNELADDDKIEFTKVMLDISQIKDRVEALSVDEDAKKSAIQSLTNAEEALVALDESAVREDDDESYGYEWECANCGTENEFEMSPQERAQYIKDWEEDNQDLVADGETGLDALNNLLDTGAESGMHYGQKCIKCGADATNPYQNEDELSRLKELSGIREDSDEPKYYEYTGKAFAIRPSGQSVWANKADIPSVINVESIMISHYPDMDDYVELTMEHDGPWEIYTDKAVEAALEKTLGMPSGSIKWSEQGQQEKGRAHFDVASTAIGKVAGSSMFKQAEHSYESFPEADEFDINEDEDFEEVLGVLGFPEDELWEAEYRGRKVALNKPMAGDVKKFKVYVKDPKSGNVKKVNFGHGGTSAKRAGQKTMRIRKSNPKARKSFRARHNCANPGPKTKARYWSCRKW
jgi:hypothetical protein